MTAAIDWEALLTPPETVTQGPPVQAANATPVYEWPPAMRSDLRDPRRPRPSTHREYMLQMRAVCQRAGLSDTRPGDTSTEDGRRAHYLRGVISDRLMRDLHAERGWLDEAKEVKRAREGADALAMIPADKASAMSRSQLEKADPKKRSKTTWTRYLAEWHEEGLVRREERDGNGGKVHFYWRDADAGTD